MRLRTGRKNPHTLYWQAGSAPDDSDRFAGSCVSGADAQAVTRWFNIGIVRSGVDVEVSLRTREYLRGLIVNDFCEVADDPYDGEELVSWWAEFVDACAYADMSVEFAVRAAARSEYELNRLRELGVPVPESEEE